jgi:O-antigen ligase
VALVALLQFFSQWWSSVEKVLVFWTQEILPFFLGSAFSETVANYSSLLVNISGATVLRASGFFPDPHIAALFFGMSLPIAFWLVMESAGSVRKYWCLCTAIIFLADLFTFSRGGYVGLIFGTSVFFLVLILRGTEWKKQIIKIGAGAIIIAAILMSPIGLRLLSSFSSDDGSKIERVRLWQEAIEFIPLRPVAGVGLGNYPLLVKPSANYREPFYAHNLFLDITLETGLVGLFFFAGFLFLGGLYAWRKWMQNKDLFALALFSSLVVFFTHSFFETPLFSVHILPLFLLLMAADLSLQDKGKV